MRSIRFIPCTLVFLAARTLAGNISAQEVVPTERVFIKRPWTVHGLSFNPATGWLTEGTQAGAIVLWNPREKPEERTLQRVIDRALVKRTSLDLALSADGKFIGASYEDVRGDKKQKKKEHEFVMWDVASGKGLYRVATGEYAGAITFHPKGKDFALLRGESAIGLREIEFRTIETGAVQRVWRPDATCITSPPSYDPDGKRAAFATQTADKKGSGEPATAIVRIWDAASGKELHALRGHKMRVRQTLFAAGGKVVVSVSWDKTICIWDAAKGEKLHTLPFAGGGSEGTVAVSADGRWLAVSGRRQAEDLAILDPETCKELAAWSCKGPLGGLYLAFSADKKMLAAAGGSTVQVWDLEVKKTK